MKVEVSAYKGDVEDEEFTGIYTCFGIYKDCPKFKNEHGSVILKDDDKWHLASSDALSADGKIAKSSFSIAAEKSFPKAFIPSTGTWKGDGGSVVVQADEPGSQPKFWKWIDGNTSGLKQDVAWNNTLLPNELPMERLVEVIQRGAAKYDEAFKEHSNRYNEAKSKKAASVVKESQSYLTCDLLDLLTPETVEDKKGNFPVPENDFIFTQNLATLLVVVPKTEEKAFLESYEMGDDEKVVPQSAKKLLKDKPDQDGNFLYRVVVYAPNHRETGSIGDAFKKACREMKFSVREYDYSESSYRNKLAEKYGACCDFNRAYLGLVDVGVETYAQVFELWVHLKILRAACEMLLRYGTLDGPSPCFVSPKADKLDLFKRDMTECLARDADKKNAESAEDGAGEEFLSYVSLTLAPVSTSK